MSNGPFEANALMRSWRCLLLVVLFAGCSDRPWNDPYPRGDGDAHTAYAAFSERPKHLDPARSYTEAEARFTTQIYEPPFQYHYLRRPYELIPLLATQIPEPVFLDVDGSPVPPGDEGAAAYTEYEVRIRPGVRYQPHPAFANAEDGSPRYVPLAPADFDPSVIRTPADFPDQGTRELVAADFVYQIKRLAHPSLHSPILSLMIDYIVGLRELHEGLREASDGRDGWLDLRQFDLAGVRLVDQYTFRIRLHGRYVQFVYWLAMPFFAPVPHEVDRFYAQPALVERNITLDWFPVGTGPYMLTANNPNKHIVLRRNPNYRGTPYPSDGEAGDAAHGLLVDAGAAMPFVDRAVFTLEKENIPFWNKFLQGYYDRSGISSDSFDQAVSVGSEGITLTDDLRARGIRLMTSVRTSTTYVGFNMLDPVVGGDSERARYLRRALAIAVDFEEYISIFHNGRALVAQGPIPPGIFGHRSGEEGINNYVYEWENGSARRKPIAEARRLMVEAGYRGGIDPATNKPLLLYFDVMRAGPDAKAHSSWWRKQFRKLGIQLVIRSTDYNRFQEKMLNGTAQIYIWGWNADYPDPENFLFLLYGANAKVGEGGENASNYRNATFDRLFNEMKNMPNGDERQALIAEMIDIARADGPWLWGHHPMQYSLVHSWQKNVKPNHMARNTLQYVRIDGAERDARRAAWNEPITWPIAVAALVLLAFAVPAGWTYWRREHAQPMTAER